MSAPNPSDPKWNQEVEDQLFNLTDVFGDVNTFSLSNDIDAFYHDVGRSLIIFGVNMGLCVMVAVVLLLLTKAEKRRTPIFILNLIALTLMFIRMLCVAILYNGPGKTLGVILLGAVEIVNATIESPTYIFQIISIFWQIVIISSLILQNRVVFSADRTLQFYLTCGLSLLGLAAIAFETTVQAFVFQDTLNLTGFDQPSYRWVSLTQQILFTVQIGLSALIFSGKLLYLTYRRRKMGFRGFGPLQVIMIMGFQCLIIPLAFKIADFYVPIDGFVTIGQTFLTCSLPLSAIWAASEASKACEARIKPSLATMSSGSISLARPASKKSFFNFWMGKGATASSFHSEVEKGSFTEESDHVMVQKTLHVVSSESPVPRSQGSYRF